MKPKKTLKSVVALSLAVLTLFSALPTAFAAQQNSYHDPADHWQEANNRTNELDANATVTHETFNCRECGQATSFLAFRTPEYTRDGQTAMTRNVRYSDGTMIGGEGKGSIRLPSGRLLDYADQTTIQVQLVKDKSPVAGMGISVTDRNDNFSSGKTDAAGQITVPSTIGTTNGDGNAKVASYFGWTNYKSMSEDIKRVKDGWIKGRDADSIYPNEHQNNKEMYLAACEDNHLTPRFEKWVNHPNYMKLVNETRMPEGATKPVQPVFDTDAALQSLERMKKQGGYYTPIGGNQEEMQGIAEEIAENLQQNVRYSLCEVGGKRAVWIENSSLTNKELNNHKAVAAFIARHIGKVYTILESGQKVYIGPELPGEYTHSKYTQYLTKTDRGAAKAKNKAVDGLGEMIEIASNRRWEQTKHPHSKDAKYGMYRYDSTFAFPVKRKDGTIQHVQAYDVELLIRNASDGKKYLYDIVNIKENTSVQIDLTKREARSAAYKAAAGGDVSGNTVPDHG